MGGNLMLEWAMWYNGQNLCVIPVEPRGKAVALPEWTEYQSRMSTTDELWAWWTATPSFNIGIVHGVNNYITLDFDHDSGIYGEVKSRFPYLFTGRIELTGSGEGYHVPLFVQEFPDFGHDNAKDRPKGNRTYKTPNGNVNIRARWCQSVAAPSIHPSGNLYRFIQDGPIMSVHDISPLVQYLVSLDPTQKTNSPRRASAAGSSGGCSDLKRYYTSVLDVFHQFGYNGPTQKEHTGEIRLLGNGGLLVDENGGKWYSFSDETGGDVIDAWGWCKFGSEWDRGDKGKFRQVVTEMKEHAGIGEMRQPVQAKARKSFNVWGPKLQRGYWS